MQVTALSQFFTMFLKVRLQGEHTLPYCLCASHGACSLVPAKGLADKDMAESSAAARAIARSGLPEPRRSAKSRAPLRSPGRKTRCRCHCAGARPALEGQGRPSANPILAPRASPLFPGAARPQPVAGRPRRP